MSEDVTARFLNLHEFVKQARLNLPQGPWDYLRGGVESETTLRRNRLAIDSIAFRPRVLRDVSKIDTSTTFLGKKIRIPVCLAPVGAMEQFVEGGAAAAGKASEQFNIPQMLSSVCQPGLEGLAKAANNFRLFQLYVRGDRAWVEDHVKRAQANGYTAFCFTVDVAHYSRRERDIAKRWGHPGRRNVGGRQFQAALNWDDMKRFKDQHPDYPLIIKGIATAEDAAMACAIGTEVIYVSNHGGRQLDHGRGSIDVLPEVVAEVKGRAAVMVDGGFMRGADVLKAVALGATMVAIGRLECIALAAAGTEGLVRAMELMQEEMECSMALLGVTTLKELNRNYLHHPVAPANPPAVFSAYPLLDLTGEGY
ncbi:MAG: alpha-hydroxy-acid oxidizing protein [Candidatus Lambdaproteobacteria bacterium]|nr:alpha-hydroxy-acid oxidizing protein [Candidatus Lambdaproteobacteria bacterium]